MGSSSIRIPGIALVVVAGCYDPVPLTGVPCSVDGHCPTGLACVAGVCGGELSTTTVTARFGAEVIDVSGNGYAATTVLGDPAEYMPRVVLDDDTLATITVAPDRSFSFESPADRGYRISQSGAGPLDVASDATAIDVRFPFYGRLDRAPVTAPTQLRFQLPNDSATSNGFVYSTGSRAVGNVTIAPTVTIDWRTMFPIGPLGLLDAERGDRAWLARLALDPQDKYSYISAVTSSAVTLENGLTTSVPGSLALAPRTRCARVTTNRADEVARVLAHYPDGGMPSAVWLVGSTPKAEYGPLGALPLVIGDVEVANDSLDVRFSAPLPAEDLIVSMQATVPRVITSSLGDLSVFSATNHAVRIEPSEQCVDASITGEVALPHTFVLDNAPIDAGQPVVSIDRTRPARLAFATSDGPVDVYFVNLLEVTAGPNLVVRRTYLTVTPEIAIEPAELVAGREYLMLVEARVGHPAAASGDFVTTRYPFGRGIAYSNVIRVED